MGDNVDLMVNARIQGTEHSNRSIHWTQQYSVLNRVNEPNLDTTRPQMNEECGKFSNLSNRKEEA